MKDKKHLNAVWKTSFSCRAEQQKGYDQIFEKIKELEQKKSEEALRKVQKKYEMEISE